MITCFIYVKNYRVGFFLRRDARSFLNDFLNGVIMGEDVDFFSSNRAIFANLTIGVFDFRLLRRGNVPVCDKRCASRDILW